MDELVQWLRAQLGEDERIALAAPSGPWAADASGSIAAADGGRVVPSVGGALDGRAIRWPEGPVVGHLVAHDPARVLREIDAKRQVLGEHLPRKPKGRPNMERHCLSCTTAQAWDDTAGESNCLTLRLLALPYADRSGYREEWRP
ncbi:DUF6221 family protein [Streptomyces sp. NPDC052773]|uniref:DUF6221 family protein n=1 Tax=Streptomyces sp. NPDC052773 TaxID=3365693 RepID=UPI0037D38274